MKQAHNLIDMVGARIGRLTVIAYAGRTMWSCLCDCGGETKVRGTDLRQKKTRSCGCLVVDASRERARERFGARRPSFRAVEGGSIEDLEDLISQ